MICSVILAAGKSSRMSTPKQLLKINGNSLIHRIVQASLDSKVDQTIVVTGANNELVSAEINDLPVTIVTNSDWNEGMGKSLKTGVQYLLSRENEKNRLGAILVLLCDQPFVDSQLIDRLINKYQSKKPGLVACSYGKTIGVPALFTQPYFDELLSLSGDKGARYIINNSSEDICTIAFPRGVVDIDTDGDFDFFKSNN